MISNIIVRCRVLLALVLAFPLALQAGETLDLPTAIELALAQNRSLVQSALAIRSREYALRGARADFAVRLRPDGNVGFSDDDSTWRYGLATAKTFSPGTQIELGGSLQQREADETEDSRRAILRVEITQPIFRNFGSLIHRENLISANRRLQETRRSHERQKADLIVQLVETYETIIRLEKVIESDESFFQRMEKLYRLTKARERQGHTTRVDTLRVGLQRGQALARLESNRERLFSARRDLSELLGISLQTEFELEPPPLLDFDTPDIEEAVRIALDNRLDYAQTLQDLADRKRGLQIARRSLYPDLSVITSYERYGEAETFSEAYELDEDGWFVGIAAGTDFNPARENASLGEAKIEAKSARQVIRITELSIAREVQQRISDYRRAHTDKKIAGRNYRLAEDRARLARRMFKIGRGDNFAVTDAEQALATAHARLLTTESDASLSGYRLIRALGTLIEYPAELKPQAARENS